MKDLRKLAEKADIAVSNLVTSGGYLNPMQANTFIRMIQEQPTLINKVRVVRMNAPQMEINKIGFASRILHAAPAGLAVDNYLASGSRAAPTLDRLTLTTSKKMLECHIPWDVIEDNIERGRLQSTIMSEIATRVAVDIDEALILSDTDSADEDLAQFDGVLKLAVSHVVDYTADPQAITKAVFKAALKEMPNKYLFRKGQMIFCTSPHVEIEYADYLANRLTTLGDTRIASNYQGALAPYGTPIQPDPLMPNSQMLFTIPKNIIWGVQRAIKVKVDEDIRADALVIVQTLRIACDYEEEDAVVKVLGLNPDAETTTTA